MVYNIKDIETIETIRRVIRDTSKLELSDLAELMKDASPEFIKYFLSLRGRANKRQRGITKKRRARAAKRPKPTLDRNSDFGTYYLEIKEAAREYLERVKQNKHGFQILDSKAKSPWALELEINSELPDQLSLYNDQPDKLKELYIKYCTMFTDGTRSIFDLSLRKLAQELDCGAILTCLHKHLVTTKRMSNKELAKAVGTSKSTMERLRHAYAMVRNYNLLLYSGTTYNELYKWRNELASKFDDNPAEAYWWQGGGVTYGDTLPAKSFEPDRNLAFDKHVYVYSHSNIDGRAKSLEKMAVADAAEDKPKKRHRDDMDLDEGDSDESIDLGNEDERVQTDDELPGVIQLMEIVDRTTK